MPGIAGEAETMGASDGQTLNAGVRKSLESSQDKKPGMRRKLRLDFPKSGFDRLIRKCISVAV